jgi:hypothetical protein
MVQLSKESNVVKWAPEKSGSYTAKSLYIQTSFGGVISKRIERGVGSPGCL